VVYVLFMFKVLINFLLSDNFQFTGKCFIEKIYKEKGGCDGLDN
jgi:hypothetical protein